MAAAIDTIAELGYGQASLARIAEAADTSKGVIIYHFGGKDELIRELLQELITRAGEYMRPRIEAEQTGAGVEGDLDGRRHVVAVLRHERQVRLDEGAAHARAADGSQIYGRRFNDAAVAAVTEMLTHFQRTGEFRSDFDPRVMAMAVRAAIDTVGPRLIREPGLDVAHHARELASLFVRAAINDEATRPEEREEP